MTRDKENELFQTMGEMKGLLEGMHDELMGHNGNKGKIKEHEERLDDLESTRDSQRGMTKILGGLIGIVTSTEIWHIFFKGPK